MGYIRGVNLGNWLVLEKWMDPAVFAGTEAEDEAWLSRLLDSEELKKRIKKHRDTYVTEEDFKRIADLGLNLVRIPVPYYLFGDRHADGTSDGFSRHMGCVRWLDRAMDWAEKYGLQVLIDLHTTPGNQNGFDNGGIIGVCKWHTQKEEVQYVLRVLLGICRRYGNREGLFGVEVVNEPISLSAYLSAPTTGKAMDQSEAEGSMFVPMAFLRPFYRAAYRLMRKYLPEDKAIVFHDGFRLSRWQNFFRKNGMKNVWLDAHIYLWAMERVVHIHRPFVYRLYMAAEKLRLRLAARHVNILVGEWSLCNRWAADVSLVADKVQKAGVWAEEHSASGQGRAKLYASAPKISLTKAEGAARRTLGKVLDAAKSTERAKTVYEKLLEEQKRRFRAVAELQLDTWKRADGWIYWNWQLEKDGHLPSEEYWKESWDFRRCLENGWMTEEMLLT
jgi:glucan 1,3-beta-glucosidase